MLTRVSKLPVTLLLSTFMVGAGATACEKDEAKEQPSAKTAAKPQKVEPPEPEGVKIDAPKLAQFFELEEVIDSEDNPVTDDKVALGRMLFYETRLSKNHDISCNSCHKLDEYGVDHLPVSLGHKKQKGTRNSPTAYNSAAQFKQFWDGRAEDVEEQAKGPILNPVEMAMPDEARVIATLQSMPEYVAAFKKAFPDDDHPVTYDNLGKAIGAFERKLVIKSDWDEFLSGKKDALTDDEKRGFVTFVDTGCPECHTSTLVGGTMFQKLGRKKPWPNQKDTGRMEVTKSASDKMMFKVPPLRLVEKTAPYFHDASAETLEEAVRLMARHQLGKELSDEDVQSIVTFLKALTGPVPKDYIEKPTLPESTDETPKADPS